MTHEKILSKLEGVQGGNGQWTARCPSHDDRRPSLSITATADGKVLLKCHANCETENIVAAMELSMSDLFPDDGHKAVDSSRKSTKQKKEVVATYDYIDESGNLLYQAVRLSPKSFYQCRPDGNGGWINNLKDTRRVLYRLPEVKEQVKKGGYVYIVEGEKDVAALERLGFCATCNAGGAGKWRKDYSEALAGAHIVIIPDNDDPGRDHAAKVRQSLEGVAGSVKVIHLPGLPDKGDVSDWIDQGHTKEELKELVTAPPVSLASVLNRIASFISDYVFFAKEVQLWAVTLWTFHTHVIDQFEVTAYLHIKSPEKGSGKTRVLEVLATPLVKNPWQAINPSEAVLYRKIEAHNPTLLLDEVDAIWNYRTASQHEGLRACINAGYRRGVTVDRCEGQKNELKAFPVFCAKALAGIGDLPDTIAHRCIPISMTRKTKDEKVKRFRPRDVQADAQAIYSDIVACASEMEFNDMTDYREERLGDRAEEVWEPLIWIADKAGGKWPERARDAALKLSADIEAEDDSLGVRLLADCWTVFHPSDDEGKPLEEIDRLPSKDLLQHLHEMEESPWDDMQFSSRRLASMLKKYGVRSGTHRYDDGTRLKGYLKSDFEDAWSRYTPLNTGSKRDIRDNGSTMRVSGEFSKRDKKEMSRIKNAPKPADRADVTDVTDKTPYIGTGEEKEEPEEPQQPTLEDDLTPLEREGAIEL